jgi:hypothetical protein
VAAPCRAGHSGDGRVASSTCPATTHRAPPPWTSPWWAGGRGEAHRGAARGGRQISVCVIDPVLGVRLRRPAPSRSMTFRMAWLRSSGTRGYTSGASRRTRVASSPWVGHCPSCRRESLASRPRPGAWDGAPVHGVHGGVQAGHRVHRGGRHRSVPRH